MSPPFMSPPLGTIDERQQVDITAVPSNYDRLLQETTAWLAKAKTVEVMVTEYRLGHRMLSLWIAKGQEEGFYLVCENCYRIEYEPDIQTSTLKIERIDGLASPYKRENAAFQVSDAQGRIRVICCALALKWYPPR